jgi:hypothetical protein
MFRYNMFNIYYVYMTMNIYYTPIDIIYYIYGSIIYVHSHIHIIYEIYLCIHIMYVETRTCVAAGIVTYT